MEGTSRLQLGYSNSCVCHETREEMGPDWQEAPPQVRC